MPRACTVLLLDPVDRNGCVETAPLVAEGDLVRVTRALRAVWPRHTIHVNRSQPSTVPTAWPAMDVPRVASMSVSVSGYATDARRLGELALGGCEWVVVMRPAALALPPAVLRALVARARARRLDVATIAGVPDDVVYVASARLLELVAHVPPVPSCITVVSLVTRLAAVLGRRRLDEPIRVGRLEAHAALDPSLVQAVPGSAWRAEQPGALLDVAPAERLDALLRQTHEALAAGRASLAGASARARRVGASARRRVLVVVPSRCASGAHTAWAALLPHLSPRDVAFLVAPATALHDQLVEAGFVVFPASDGLAAGSAAGAATLLHALATARPSVVHLDGAECAAWAASLFGRGVRLVQHVRLNDVARFRTSFPFVDAIVAVAPRLRESIARTVGDAVPVAYIPDGVEVPRRRSGRAASPHRMDAYLCLCVGRVEPAKDHLRAIEIFEALRRRLHARLVVVGPCGSDPAYCDVVRDRLIALGDAAEWRPSTRAMQEIYAQADVVLVASRNEALGMVGLEALASGALLVAHRSSGYEAIVDPARHEGLLFDHRESADGIARRVADALRQAPVYRRHARRKVVRAFAARDTAARLERLWRSIRGG